MNKQMTLLYILPDVAYIVDLVGNKPDGSFSVQSYLQLNGQFLDENEFIVKNIDKLFKRIKKTNYQLILPDFLFTNTIVNVKETEDDKIAAYLKNSLLPSLGIDTDHYSLDTTILTTIKNSTKVQLSAIEKSLVLPISVLADKHQVGISTVSPLTWTLKSIISLEPSISLVQLGENVYSGLHYIGVDQTNMAKLDQLEILAETIKTLKGSEPNIQTIYLASNSLVEERLKQVLSTTLPIQQLVTNREELEGDISPYLKFTIEAGARTLSIPDYPVPRFKLDTPTDEEKETIFNQVKAELDQPTKETATKPDVKDKPEAEKVATAVITAATSTKKLDLNQASAKTSSLPKPAQVVQQKQLEEKGDQNMPEKNSNLDIKNVDQSKTETTKAKPAVETKPDVDISQFAYNQKTASNNQLDKGENKMLKMVFITIAVFFATIAIGAGIGFGLLTLTNKNNDQAKDTEVVVTTPAPSPTETPTPTAVEMEPLSILVANATTKAGYAGATKDKILEANKNAEKNVLKEVTAANAKGSYQKPAESDTQLLLMKEKNDAVKTALEKATGFKLEYADGIKTEDPNGKYDAVIILVQ